MMKGTLEDISDAEARSKAQTAIYAEIRGLIDQLWDQPGNGAAIEIKFVRISHPQHVTADIVQFAGLQSAIGPSPNIKVPEIVAMEAERGFNPENVKAWHERIWIEPVRQNQSGVAQVAPSKAPQEMVKVPINSMSELVAHAGVTSEPVFGASLRAYELLAGKTPSFSGFEIELNHEVLLITHDVYKGLVSDLQTELTNRLTRRANQLSSDIAAEKRKLDGYLQEGFFSIRIGSGTFDLRKHEHMFDDPILSWNVAVGLIKACGFRAAWEEIQKGERKLFENFKILYHWSTGRHYEGPGTSNGD